LIMKIADISAVTPKTMKKNLPALRCTGMKG
jgi:hypothetical protein